MKIGMKLSELLEGIIGQYVVVECDGSCYNGWKGKVISFSGTDGNGDGREAGVNVVCDMMDISTHTAVTLSFTPSALRFL